jgi:hypothetical protein
VPTAMAISSGELEWPLQTDVGTPIFPSTYRLASILAMEPIDAVLARFAQCVEAPPRRQKRSPAG